MAATTKKKAAAPQRKPLPDHVADANNPAILAAAEEMGRVAPVGMPALLPMHALARRKRADLKADMIALMDKLDDQQRAMTELRAELGEDATDESMTKDQRSRAGSLIVELERLTADATDALCRAAVDEASFSAWAESVDEQTVFEALSWYWRQAGEARGSQTS